MLPIQKDVHSFPAIYDSVGLFHIFKHQTEILAYIGMICLLAIAISITGDIDPQRIALGPYGIAIGPYWTACLPWYWSRCCCWLDSGWTLMIARPMFVESVCARTLLATTLASAQQATPLGSSMTHKHVSRTGDSSCFACCARSLARLLACLLALTAVLAALACLLVCLLACLVGVLACLFAWLGACLLAYLIACLLACLFRRFLLACFLAYFLACCACSQCLLVYVYMHVYAYIHYTLVPLCH